jgi:hypothetical protein
MPANTGMLPDMVAEDMLSRTQRTTIRSIAAEQMGHRISRVDTIV